MRSIEKGLEKSLRERGVQGNREAREFESNWDQSIKDLSRLSAYLVTVLEPASLAAEQFKRLRTHVLKRMKSKMENALMVASAVQGEGKTTTAINLAISISQGMNDTVLMIDADLRKPGVHTHLGIEADKGLVDYLSGDAELPDLLVKTEVPKLTLLPSGKPPDNPSELLSSEKMAHLIQEVKTRYPNRFVILDTSPLNVFTDASVLVPQVDGTLLVVKDGITSAEYVQRAISQLEREKILGIALNMISGPESLQDAYYYYDYDKRG